MSRKRTDRKPPNLSSSPAKVIGGIKGAVLYLFTISGVVNVLALNLSLDALK